MAAKEIVIIAITLFFFTKSLYEFQFQCAKLEKARESMTLNIRQAYVQTKYGFGLIVDVKDDLVYRSLLSEGTWEPHLLYLMSKIVKQNERVLNIGSQNGLQAILLGKMIGKGGSLFIMEPSSLNYRIVVKNIYLNSLQDISKCYLIAAGMEKNQIYLQINQKNPQKQLLTYRTSDTTDSQYEMVTVERVDLLLPPATKLDFAYLKSGVYQFQALYGMKEVISQSVSLIVLIKHNYFFLENRDYMNAPQLFFEFLQKKGFTWLRYMNGEDCRLGRFQQLTRKQLLMPNDYTLLLIGPEVQADKKLLLGLT